MFKHILVPTDGSELSDDTVEKAVMFAKEIGAKITFFCGIEPFPSVYYGLGAVFDAHLVTNFHEIQQKAAETILEAAAKVGAKHGIGCTTAMLSSAEPYEAIIKAAQDGGCDLIFMASHGRKGMEAVILGSETQKVLTHSKIPVLVYR